VVEIIRGTLKTYEYRSDESHRWIKIEFCPNCGSTTWTVEFFPGMRAITGGTLDDPNWLTDKRHYRRDPLHLGCSIPPGAEVSPTDQFPENDLNDCQLRIERTPSAGKHAGKSCFGDGRWIWRWPGDSRVTGSGGRQGHDC
jgi:hypothetical protein